MSLHIMREYQEIPPDEMCDYSRSDMEHRQAHGNTSPSTQFQSFVDRFERALPP